MDSSSRLSLEYNAVSFSPAVCLFMDYSFQANGSFAVPILYNRWGVFSTPHHKYFSCSWLCRFVFDKPQYLIIDGFAARLAEMDRHTVISRADTLCEAALFTWYLLLFRGWCCLHGIDSFLLGGCSDMVVVGYHLFLWGVCPSDFCSLQSRGFRLILFFPLSSQSRSCVLPCLTLGAFSRSLSFASRPGVFHAKVAVSRYLTGCGIQFCAAMCFSCLSKLSHISLTIQAFSGTIQVTV